MRWLILILGLELPSILSLVDCLNRDPHEFPGGAADRGSWVRWLAVSFLLIWVLVGYGIVLGYYWSVVKRSAPRTS